MADDLPLRMSWMGEGAILCDTDADGLDLARQERFWALADRLAGTTNYLDIVPGMNNLLVCFDPLVIAGEAAMAEIGMMWQRAERRQGSGRLIDIPVRYGGADGEDLSEVAAVAGLSPRDYVERHAGGRYTVFAIGSQPGFGYLAGLDPALAVPRRAVPRVSVDAGCVVIGGAQAGVISRRSPSGWHIIGRTDVSFFDPVAERPALLAPGDTIRFQIESLNL